MPDELCRIVTASGKTHHHEKVEKVSECSLRSRESLLADDKT